MSEQTNPEGSRRSNREVTRDLAALFMGEQEPEEVQEADGDDLDDEEIVAEGDDEGG